MLSEVGTQRSPLTVSLSLSLALCIIVLSFRSEAIGSFTEPEQTLPFPNFNLSH